MADEQLAVSFECTPVHETSVTPGAKSISRGIAEAVADVENVEPDVLPPLYECIDPDAIEQLVDHQTATGDSTLGVCFTYHGWNVFVRGDGTITVADPGKAASPTPLF